MNGNFTHENREISNPSGKSDSTLSDRAKKAKCHNVAMHGFEKSDESVVPMNSLNKTEQSVAEGSEGRGSAMVNSTRQNTPRTQSRTSVTNALRRIQQIAKAKRDLRFTALLHHITIERLRSAYGKLEPKASPGVDGVTWQEYGVNLQSNLESLHERVHRGVHRPQPARRMYIPKADGKQRPLGIASLEDKVLQSAVTEVLNAIFEADFVGFSYGFRQGRSAHDALDALAYALRMRRINFILDADIRGFFDSINHEWMKKFVNHRIADTRITRLIQKWLAAGVMEGGKWTEGELGTPQGAIISPLLANLYLHHVLDLWIDDWRKRHARGQVVIVRYGYWFRIPERWPETPD